MTLGYTIALAIFIIAIIALVFAGFKIARDVSRSMESFQDTQENIETINQHFTQEIEYLSGRFEEQSRRGEAMAQDFAVKVKSFDELSREIKELETTIETTQAQSTDIGENVFNEAKEYAKHELPKKWDKTKKVVQRTYEKQKDRYFSE